MLMDWCHYFRELIQPLMYTIFSKLVDNVLKHTANLSFVETNRVWKSSLLGFFLMNCFFTWTCWVLSCYTRSCTIALDLGILSSKTLRTIFYRSNSHILSVIDLNFVSTVDLAITFWFYTLKLDRHLWMYNKANLLSTNVLS